MAVVFESIGTVDSTTSTSDTDLVLGAPSGIQDDDVLIMAVASEKSTSITLSGWTELIDANELWVAWKIASSESGDYTVDTGGTYSYAQGVVMRFSGNDDTTPIDDSAGTFTSAWNQTVAVGDVTIADDGSGLAFIGAPFAKNSYSNIDTCSFSGSTQRLNSVIAANTHHCLWIYTADDVSAQSTSGETMTLMSGDGCSGKQGVTVAIAPSAGGGGGISIPVVMHHRRQIGAS